jgi:hypothetical protein
MSNRYAANTIYLMLIIKLQKVNNKIQRQVFTYRIHLITKPIMYLRIKIKKD